jgi:5-methylcytosine-specific restriction enzyme subunit McrC
MTNRNHSRPIVVEEYKTKPDVELTDSLVAALNAYRNYLQLTPGSAPGLYNLTASSWVGAISVGSLDIEIRPKLSIDRLLFLVSYALDSDGWLNQPFEYEADATVFEAMIPAFARLVRQALRRGLLRGYRSEETALQTVRGRIRFEEQVRKRFGRFPPAEVMYDEYTEDILENRLLKAAVDQLATMQLRSSAVRRMLRSFRSTLAGVSLERYHPRDVPVVFYNRLNEHYRPAVELARLIIASTSFRLRRGGLRSWAFLMDMNKVFEDFVVVALREALEATPYSFPQGARGKQVTLDHGGHIRLEPDISWWDGDECRFVGDVKYKAVGTSGFKHGDIYQLLGYLIATDLPQGMLVYAAGEEEPRSYHIRHVGKRIEVRTVDLADTPEGLLHQIERIADRVREMAKVASGSDIRVRSAVGSVF